MLPVLFSLGPITVYTFGLIMFVAFFGFSFVVWKRGRELHFDEEQLFDAVFMILFWFLITARLGYVATHLNHFAQDVWGMFNIFGKPGLMYFSGLIGGGVAAYVRAKKNNWDTYTFGDVLAVATTLALVLISFGMFLNGSGAGIATNSIFGVKFVGLVEKRIPVQLLEMILYLILFVLLWWLENRYRTFSWYKGKRSEAQSGFLMACFLIGQGLIGLLALTLKPVDVVYFVRLDLLIYFVSLVLGFVLLTHRSGKKWGDILRQQIKGKR